jgi:hypothetical protein
LEANGIDTIFDNPGSTEEGLLDEISRYPGIRYVLEVRGPGDAFREPAAAVPPVREDDDYVRRSSMRSVSPR